MKKRAWITVAMFVVITLFPLFGNIVTKDGGILDDAILDKTNQTVWNEKYIELLSTKGLKTGDAVPFVFSFPNGISKESLKGLIWFAAQVKENFGDYAQLSVCNAPKYLDTGNSLSSIPHLTKEKLNSDAFSVQEWKNSIIKDPAVYGSLIGKNFNYAVVTVFLPNGENEQEFFRKVADFLEQRKINRLEWFIKTDIKPAAHLDNITVAGWAMARGLITASLVADIMKLSTIGLICVWIFFWLSLMSVRQASIATILIVLSGIWTRGSIGLIQQLEPYTGFIAYERVYILLIYTTLIVAGISFAARKFETYNELRLEYPNLSRYEIWKRAHGVNQILAVTGLLSIINFLTLYQIGVRGILEVGIFSALGLVYLLAFAFKLLPALHILIGGEANERQTNKIGLTWNRWLEAITTECFFFVWKDKESIRRRAWYVIIFTSLLAAIPILLIVNDYYPKEKQNKNLEVRTRPLEYIPGTISYRASVILNGDGGYGFDRLSILIESKNGDSTESPGFIGEVARLQEKIAKLSETRKTNSVIDMLGNISRESYKKSLPSTTPEIHDSLFLIEEDLGQLIKEQFWFNNGLVIFTSLAANDSNVMGDYIKKLQGLSGDFPNLKITTFGKLTTYPEADRYIREGKPWNVFSSFWIINLGCAIWVWYRNRKFLCEAIISPFKTGVAITLPFIFASSIITLYMIAFHVPLDQATACITALAVNAAVDFSLYLVADFHDSLGDGKLINEAMEIALLRKGKVIVMDIVLNALCFIPLIFSNFIPVSRLGGIMVIMMFTCGIGSFILLPILLLACVND